MRIFFSAGEPSGDQHAAQLILRLRQRVPDLQAVGFGGPEMRSAGCELTFQLTDLAVMGFVRVAPLLWRFVRLVKQAEREFRQRPPDAVVLVDFPGFNWWVARKAKAAGVPVFYYLPPQLWAWASWRVKKVRRYVDRVLCALPFEYEWYRRRNVRADWVGHPFFDKVAAGRLDDQFLSEWSGRSGRPVAVLPGSRDQEIAHNWPLMLHVLRRVAAQHPDVRFLVACYRPSHQERCQRLLRETAPDLPAHFFVGRTSEVIELGQCALMVSGSVSLEMLARATPAVVLYHVNWFTFALGRQLINCDYISLPNLMARCDVLPEFVCLGRSRHEVRQIANRLNWWLSHPESLAAARRELEQLREQVVRPGASARAADVILRELSRSGAPDEDSTLRAA